MGTRAPTIRDLERWLQFGAGLRIVGGRDGHAVYELCTCTGETVERHESDDPALIDFLIARAGPESDEG